MNTELKPEDIEFFFIRLYFDTSKGFMHAAMQRAYRDFNRTIQNIPKENENRSQWRYKLYELLQNQISIVIDNHIQCQQEFDSWHEKSCYLLIDTSKNILTIGQSQKWINMTLKYLYSFGEKRIAGITRNYIYFHIPIDNIIQNAFNSLYSIKRIPIAWSRINEYETYFNYQLEIRKILIGKIVMDEEFRLFNTNLF